VAHKADNCISEFEFVDLWNRMHNIPMGNVTDECLTAEKFVHLVSENIHGRKDKELYQNKVVYEGGLKSSNQQVVYTDGGLQSSNQ
jgi:hypothetical protein